jgi:hypothetical protein
LTWKQTDFPMTDAEIAQRAVALFRSLNDGGVGGEIETITHALMEAADIAKHRIDDLETALRDALYQIKQGNSVAAQTILAEAIE